MKFNKIKVPFSQVANSVLNDPKLTWKAKGVFAYMNSKPDGWDFAVKRITIDSKDGERATATGLNELEENGYLIRVKKDNGRMEYLLDYTKMALNTPNLQNSRQAKQQTAKTEVLSNKDIISNKDKEIIVNTTSSIKGETPKVGKNLKTFEDGTIDKRNNDVEDILTSIQDFHGTVDGKIQENRQFAYLLANKIKKIPGFNNRGKTVGEFITVIIENTDKYKISKTTSPKNIFYELGGLMSSIKAGQKNNKKITIG